MSENKRFWFRLLADAGFLILPNGLTGPSTTLWIRPWSAEGQKERVEQFCDEQYEVRFLDTFIWFEEEPVKKHMTLLSSSFHRLHQLFQANHIMLPPASGEEEEFLWSGERGYRLKALHLQEAQELLLKAFLLHLSLVLSEIGVLATPQSYSAEMNYRVAINEYIQYGFCYLSIEKLGEEKEPF